MRDLLLQILEAIKQLLPEEDAQESVNDTRSAPEPEEDIKEEPEAEPAPAKKATRRKDTNEC